jgi:hypothetical protein
LGVSGVHFGISADARRAGLHLRPRGSAALTNS